MTEHIVVEEQVIFCQRAVGAEHQGTLNHIAQFTDVSRPVISQEATPRLIGDPVGHAWRAMLLQHMRGQGQDVHGPLGQGQNPQSEGADPEVKI
ncbi:MAG: hypothetical protein ACKOFK_00870, partial [Betaproteobacteria bacterium]